MGCGTYCAQAAGAKTPTLCAAQVRGSRPLSFGVCDATCTAQMRQVGASTSAASPTRTQTRGPTREGSRRPRYEHAANCSHCASCRSPSPRAKPAPLTATNVSRRVHVRSCALSSRATAGASSISRCGLSSSPTRALRRPQIVARLAPREPPQHCLARQEVWWERPAARSASSGGAWTMAWWCTAEATSAGTAA